MSSLAFKESGPRTAPTVLFLHGFMGSLQDWASVTDLLAQAHRCLAVDLPGHGATAAPENEALWTPEGCVAALAGLLAAAGGGSVVGYSLGGRLALELAVEHPGLVSRAVLVSASPGIADEAARGARRSEDEQRARRLETRGLGPFLDDWYRQPLFAPLREHPGYPAVLERRRRNDPRLLARSLRTMGTGSQRSLWGGLAGLRTPLLFLAGERDAKFTALALDAVALCRQAEAVVLRGRGHALVEEDPAAVARETQGFLGAGP
ncbi:MAG: 2-succinyl-6-hydroxy-2,4-cyclohexadiene-1-carboxylate synthase [Candidatus Methylomirabilia bacterium]